MLKSLPPGMVEVEKEEKEGTFRTQLHLPDEQDSLHACFRLRHSYFVQQRGWVASDDETPGLERDDYDDHALHLGVWDGDGLAAYLRVLPYDSEVGFMIDHELSCVLSEETRLALPREGAVELSRLVVRSDVPPRYNAPQFHPVELLLRRLYHLSLERDFRSYCIVVEQGWMRPFARRFGLPFKVIGTPHTFPDGTRTVAAMATREELEAGMRRHSQAKYAWYQTNESR